MRVCRIQAAESVRPKRPRSEMHVGGFVLQVPRRAPRTLSICFLSGTSFFKDQIQLARGKLVIPGVRASKTQVRVHVGGEVEDRVDAVLL
jgi:hypothetical protein